MKSKLLMRALILIVIAVIVVLGIVVWKKQSQVMGQKKMIKTANESYGDDARYINFGVDYMFAVPKSFSIDEVSISGIQLIIPNGLNLQIDKVDQLYDAAVVAVQPVSEIKANDNASVKKYVEKSLVPDLKKNLSPDISVKFSKSGKYQAAIIVAKKNGKQVRQVYVYGGAHPFMVASKEVSDAYLEVTSTILSIPDSKHKAEVPKLKAAVQATLSSLQKGEVQKVYDMGTAEFKKSTSTAALTGALKSSSEYINRNILVVGGSLLNDRFTSQVYYPGATKEDKVGYGLVNLQKEDGEWKVSGINFPTKN